MSRQPVNRAKTPYPGYIRGMDDRDIMTVFDRETVRRHRDRAAAGFSAYDFLFTEIAERLGDRLDDVVRDFPWRSTWAAILGRSAGCCGGRKGIETLVECDLSPAMVQAAGGGFRVAGDEELLPFADFELRPGDQQSKPPLGERSAGSAAPAPARVEA